MTDPANRTPPSIEDHLREELAQARADVERLRAERDDLAKAAAGYKMLHAGGVDLANRYLDDAAKAERACAGLSDRLAATTAERDRLLAEMDTSNDKLEALAHAIREAHGFWVPGYTLRDVLLTIRARAGITDSVPAGRAPPVGDDSPCDHPAPAGEGPEAGIISPQPVPYGHCNRCPRCGWAVVASIEVSCWITCCPKRPLPPLLTHCAGCGAPFEGAETKGET